jgi:hypothetical protein
MQTCGSATRHTAADPAGQLLSANAELPKLAAGAAAMASLVFCADDLHLGSRTVGRARVIAGGRHATTGEARYELDAGALYYRLG